MSNISCQIHLNNLSLPAVTDINCRWDGALRPPKMAHVEIHLTSVVEWESSLVNCFFVVWMNKVTYALQSGRDFENA